MSIKSISLASILFLGAGCLVVSDKELTYTGVRVSDKTLAQITPGETTGDWLKVTLGPPSAETKLANGNSVLRYTYSEVKNSSGAVFLLFKREEDVRTEKTVLFELDANDRVLRSWRAE